MHVTLPISYKGTHAWQASPVEGEIYVAGIDVAGEERPNPDGTPSRTRDSTVVTIGRVRYNELMLPEIAVVHHQWWTGMQYTEQYAAVCSLVETWNLRAIVIDQTGLGHGLAAMLVTKFNSKDHEPVMPFTFSRPSKSRLAYQFLSLTNQGRLKLYKGGPRETTEECWDQLRKARYRLPAPEMMDFYVEQSEEHDDFLISLALVCEGLEQLVRPAESTIVKPVQLYGGESPY